jgi:hypothetical protein
LVQLIKHHNAMAGPRGPYNKNKNKSATTAQDVKSVVTPPVTRRDVIEIPPLPTPQTYQPAKYRILQNVSMPGRKEQIWHLYPFKDIPLAVAPAFIPKSDDNSDPIRVKEAIKQFQKQPSAKIQSGENKGQVMEFKVMWAPDPNTDPPEEGVQIWRIK